MGKTQRDGGPDKDIGIYPDPACNEPGKRGDEFLWYA